MRYNYVITISLYPDWYVKTKFMAILEIKSFWFSNISPIVWKMWDTTLGLLCIFAIMATHYQCQALWEIPKTTIDSNIYSHGPATGA